MNSSDREPACFHARVVKRESPSERMGGGRTPRRLAGLWESLLQAGSLCPAAGSHLGSDKSLSFQRTLRRFSARRVSVNVPTEAAGPGAPSIVLFMDPSVIIQV